MGGPGDPIRKTMARRLSKGETVLFISGDSKQRGTITDTYVRQRKRLYTVKAESGDLYDGMPVDTKASPRYRILLALTEKYLENSPVDGGGKPENLPTTEVKSGKLARDGGWVAESIIQDGPYVGEPIMKIDIPENFIGGIPQTPMTEPEDH